jgi:hypothetical protein
VVQVEVVVSVTEVEELEVAVVDLQILVETGVAMATLKKAVEVVVGNGVVVVEEVMGAGPGLILVETGDPILMNLRKLLQV